MSLASHASEREAAELDYDNHPDDEGNQEPLTEGWFWPDRSRKAHYFVDGRSLCGKWGFPGDLEPYGEFSSDDCAMCARKAKERHDDWDNRRPDGMAGASAIPGEYIKDHLG